MIRVETSDMEQEDINELKEFLVNKGFDFEDFGLQNT